LAQDAAVPNNEGTRLLQAGRLEAALDQFQKAVALAPDDPALHFNVGLALFRLERYRDALAELDQSLRHPASEPNARFLRGNIYYQFGELERCAAEFEKVREHPRYGEAALYRLADAYRRLGRIEASQQAFVELNRLYPDSPFAHQLMGMAYDSMHQPAEALREFEAALNGNPRLPEAAFGAGFVRFKEGNLDQAAQWLRREIELDPCHAASLRYLGEIALRQAHYQEAAERFEQSAHCNPNEPQTYLGWGTALERLQQVEAALKLYQKAVEMDSESSDAQYRLGRVLQSLGRTEEARAAFERVKQLRSQYNEQAQRDLQSAGGKQQ
jgi:tetratricopeptide (TPR) repeat protein